MKQFKTLVYLISIIFVVSGFSKSHFDRMEAALLQKDYEQTKELAQQYLAKASDLSSNQSQKVQYYLGLSQLYLKDYSNAKQSFEKLIGRGRSGIWHDKAYLGLFNVKYMQGDYQAALKVTQRLMRVSKESPVLSLIHLKIARANLKLANWSEARKHLDIIVRQFPKSMEYHTAKQLLEEKQYFAVQVGAYKDRKGAQSIVNDLNAKGEYGYIVATKDQNNQKLYRVRVGKLGQLKEAQHLQKKLAQKGYPALIYP